MKQSRFTEERITAILREQEAGFEDGGRLPQARDSAARRSTNGRPSMVAWTYQKLGASKVLTDENAKLKKLLAEAMLDNAMLKSQFKKCMVRPGVARSFLLLSEAACVNVSGLSRVSYLQPAMMRCARIVPKKWYEQEGLDFLTGLTMRRSTVPTSVLGPRN